MKREDTELLEEFKKSRNLTQKTLNGYKTTLRLYIKIQGKTFKQLLYEAEQEEIKGIRWKNRKLKQRLIQFRTYLIENKYYEKSLKEYMSRIRTLYRHHEIEIHPLPKMSDKNITKPAPISYRDLPDKEQIRKALDISTTLQKALILFMSSSGCARKETLSLTIQDFIDATFDYHHSNDIAEIIRKLNNRDDIVPMFKVHRKKTNKHYITFCSPEATKAIINYLIDRVGKLPKGQTIYDKLKPEMKLFKINDKYITDQFGEINQKLALGTAGSYRKFRTHMLRKWHASTLYNDGMSRDDINDLQGKAKNRTDQSYFFEDPLKLKEKYIQHLDVLTINLDVKKLDIKSPEYIKLENTNKELEEKVTKQQAKYDKIIQRIEALENRSDEDILNKFKK